MSLLYSIAFNNSSHKTHTPQQAPPRSSDQARDMPTHHPNTTNKSNLTTHTFTLLPTTNHSTITLRRQGRPLMMSSRHGNRLQALKKEAATSSSEGTMHAVEAITRKRKHRPDDEGVEGVVERVKKLKVSPSAPDPWEGFEEMVWEVRRGKLYGRWGFEGQG